MIRTNIKRSGSFGVLFLSRYANRRRHPKDELRHEYGHAVQMKRMGIWKYLLYIGIPSLFDMGDGNYYDKPWEVTADLYGGVKSRIHAKKTIIVGKEYLEKRS